MWKLGDLAIEPEMNSRDRRRPKAVQPGFERHRNFSLRQQTTQALEWRRKHGEIKPSLSEVAGDGNTAFIRHECGHRIPQQHLSASRLNIADRGGVQI